MKLKESIKFLQNNEIIQLISCPTCDGKGHLNPSLNLVHYKRRGSVWLGDVETLCLIDFKVAKRQHNGFTNNSTKVTCQKCLEILDIIFKPDL